MDNQPEPKVPVTAVVQLKHGILRQLSKKLGSQSAAAAALGVSPQEFGAWINLRKRPSRHWSEEKALAFSVKLLELTGHTADEIWPDWLDECLGCVAKGEKTQQFSASDLKSLVSPVESPAGFLEARPDSLWERLNEVLKTLTHREQQVLRYRYGLTEEGTMYSLLEVSRIFKVTQERVRQIETRALSKMRQLERSDRLREFVYPNWEDMVPPAGTPDPVKNKPE